MLHRAARLLLPALASACACLAGSLPIHPERASITDLEISGFSGQPEGASGFVRWADIANLPQVQSKQDPTDWLTEPQQLKILFLADLWQALGVDSGTDTLIADCSDGYQSNFPSEYIDAAKPFLVLEVNGQQPEQWPRGSLKFWPGPYVIHVSEKLAPEYCKDQFVLHKRPYAVSKIRAVRWKTFAEPLYTGGLANPTPAVARGRELYQIGCSSCHNVNDTLGGKYAHRPTLILSVFANSLPDYFKGYVRNPKDIRPDSRMPAHPTLTAEELEGLRAFVQQLHPTP